MESHHPGSAKTHSTRKQSEMIRKFDKTEQYDTSMKIIFATNNAHKLSEVQAVLGPDFELVTPRSVGITEEIPEQQDTIAGNASQKARYPSRIIFSPL